MVVVNRLILFECLACLSFCGCVLDEPPKYGEPCQNIAYIWENTADGTESKDTEKCMRGDCPRYNKFFDADYCPESTPYCITDESNENYCISSCSDNHHFVMGSKTPEEWTGEGNDLPEHLCEADTVAHCGTPELDCSNDPQNNPGWEAGYCDTQTTDNYPCIATSCKPFYKFDNFDGDKISDRCTRYDLCCGKVCANCTKNSEPDKAGTANYGLDICSSTNDDAVCIKSCEEGFKTCKGVCIAKQENCE